MAGHMPTIISLHHAISCFPIWDHLDEAELSYLFGTN